MNVGDQARFNIIRVDRISGKREAIPEGQAIEGRWRADAAKKKLDESNRDPNMTYEVEPVSKEGVFRAAAFGDPTKKMPSLKGKGW